MKTPYTLSTDYAELFELIQDGSVIAGFVTTEKYTDDIARIRKRSDGDYTLGVRGHEYLSLPVYWRDFPEGYLGNTEKEAFAIICESVNLRWIKP